MPTDPLLSLAAVRAVIKELKVGDEFKIRWADSEDPDVIMSWTCKVTAKPSEDLAHFRSTDSDDPDEDWEIPAFKDNHVPSPTSTDADLDLNYHYLAKTTQVVAGRKSMKSAKLSSYAKSTICAWKPSSWMSWLKPGDLVARKCVVDTLFEQLQIPERINQGSFKTVEDWEACALGEILLSQFDLILVVNNEVRDCPQMERSLMATIVRLCELKVGRGKTGEARTKAMTSVRTAYMGSELHNDPLTKAMLGLPLTNGS